MRLAKKFRHGFLCLGYGIIYYLFFCLLEKRTNVTFHLIPAPFNDLIPFCKYFIIPYLFWFVYMLMATLSFIFLNPNKHEFYQLFFNLVTGMTLFLLISYLYPNMLNIRPTNLTGDDLFSDLVLLLYRHDTPTNVLPSIHVFNSIAVHTAISQSEMVKDKWLKYASLFLTIAIITSTLFLKQHSLIDAVAGILLAFVTYLIFYKSPLEKHIPYGKKATVKELDIYA